MAAIPNSDQYNKTLPKDQQKLADAASTNVVKTDADSGRNPLKDAAKTFGGEIAAGSALLGAGKVTGINALRSLGTGTIRYSPHMTAAVGGYGIGKKLDEKFDISGLMGDFYGPMLAKFRGVDTNTGAITPEERLAIDSGRNPAVEQKGNIVQGPITPSERGAIDANLNPNKPIENPMGLSTITGKYGAGNDDNVIAYEPLARKSQEELATAATEDYASQFEGAYQNKDGSYTGLTTAGGKQSMTPEQYASYAEQQKLGLGNPNAVPMGDYTPVAGTDGFVQQPLGYTPPAPQAPQAPTPRAPQESKQMVAASNFADARDAGTITPDKVAAAEEYAASMGRTFDANMGYSKDFDQSILDKYNAERNASQQEGQQGGQQNIQQAQGRSSYATESAAREARMDARPDFGSAQMRDSSGKMVNVTPENREKRDIEKGLKQEAREAGYTPEQTRTYVADKMRERSESVSDREFELKLRDQNFSQGEANLARTLKGLQEETDVEEEDYFNIVSELGKLGVGIDTETGNLTYMKEDAGFAYFDKEVNLAPDSELYNKVMQMKGGAQFLAPPMYVQEAAKTAKEGEVIVADDGTKRAYKVINGKLVQVK